MKSIIRTGMFFGRVDRAASTDDGGRLEVDVFVVDSFVTTTAFADRGVKRLARRLVLRVVGFLWRVFDDARVDGPVACLISLALSVRIIGLGEAARFVRRVVTRRTVPRGI